MVVNPYDYAVRGLASIGDQFSVVDGNKTRCIVCQEWITIDRNKSWYDADRTLYLVFLHNSSRPDSNIFDKWDKHPPEEVHTVHKDCTEKLTKNDKAILLNSYYGSQFLDFIR